MALLEAVMEGLVDARSGTLRALCASLCAEWLNWSDKHVRHALCPASQSPSYICSPRQWQIFRPIPFVQRFDGTLTHDGIWQLLNFACNRLLDRAKPRHVPQLKVPDTVDLTHVKNGSRAGIVGMYVVD